MPPRHDDPALEALLFPFLTGRLPWPQSGALFLRARAGRGLVPSAWPGLACEQSFKPEAEALEQSGFSVNAQDGSRHRLVLVLPPRQREEARALLAEALARVEGEDGVVIASVPNLEGAKAIEADLARIAGPVSTLSKHKCRVFWARPNAGEGDAELAARWRSLDSPRPILEGTALEGRFTSRPGVFAWDRVDPASVLLAETLGSVGAGHCVDRARFTCVGQEINANHLRPAPEGSIVTAVARPVHIGRSSQVWNIEIRNERDQLVCVSRLTLAAIAASPK